MNREYPADLLSFASFAVRSYSGVSMKPGADRFNLQRFVDAQDPVLAEVLEELQRGRKHGHWIWFIFPQLKGLGRSSMSEFYGISCLAEAVEYLQHPLLGPRLLQCTELVNAAEGTGAEAIFGEVDAMKFRSSMTLFAKADPDNPVFVTVIERYFCGEFDPLTIQYLDEQRR